MPLPYTDTQLVDFLAAHSVVTIFADRSAGQGWLVKVDGRLVGFNHDLRLALCSAIDRTDKKVTTCRAEFS